VSYGEAEMAVLYIHSSPTSFIFETSSPNIVRPPFPETTPLVRHRIVFFLIIIMTSPQPIELGTHDHKTETTCHAVAGLEDQLERAEVKDDSLPPQDGGSGAWLFLFGACVFEIVSWGKCLVDYPPLFATD
jgi:hypothetical protein